MSYARFADDSDVYVFLAVGGELECCSCSLAGDGQCFTSTTTAAMIAHLREHQEAGHAVPDSTFERLEAEGAENDIWMSTGRGVA